MLKSQFEAVHLGKTDRETGMKTLVEYLKRLKDRELLEQSYGQIARRHARPYSVTSLAPEAPIFQARCWKNPHGVGKNKRQEFNRLLNLPSTKFLKINALRSFSVSLA